MKYNTSIIGLFILYYFLKNSYMLPIPGIPDVNVAQKYLYIYWAYYSNNQKNKKILVISL